jgi:putative spermidine/putrescine transport system permease protein
MRGILYALGGTIAAFGLLVVVAPILLVVILSFSSSSVFTFPPPGFSLRWHEEVIALPQLVSAFSFSLQLAVLAATLSVTIATIGAFRLVTARGLVAKMLRNLMMAPLVFPSMILGLALLVYFRTIGIGVFEGLVLAHVTIGVPYAFQLVVAQLQSFDPHLDEASQSLGAGPMRSFFSVTLPLIWPGIAVGWLFAFIVSLGELNTALFLTTPQFRTLPIELFGYLQFEGNELVVAAASTIQLAVVLLVGSLIQLANTAYRRRLQTPL